MFAIVPTTVALTFCGYAMPRQWLAANTGVSPDSKALASEVTAVAKSIARPIGFLGARAEVVSQLVDLFEEHDHDGWDGLSSPAVSYATVENVERFLRALPADIPNPELAVDPDDGSISLDWRSGRRRIFSVSIGERDSLPYAFLDGNRRGHAVDSFDGTNITPALLASIRQILE